MSNVAIGFPNAKQVPELLHDQVADHPLRLRVEDVERVGLDVLVGGALKGEQPDLRAVAVRNHELVLVGERCELRATHAARSRAGSPR